MDYINFSGPINSLSFGNVTINMLRELHKLDQKTCFFPVGNNLDFDAYDKLSEDCKSWITDSYHNRLKNLNKDNSSLKMWHLMGSESTVGSRSFLYTFYECDQPTETEVNLSSMHEKTIFSSSHSEECFKSKGLTNTEYIPIGFDEDFFETGKEYLGEKINFGLVGKFEKRKHTAKILKLWAEKYGDNLDYQLTCCITNPFFKEDQMKLVIASALGGKTYKNINFLPHLKTNSEMNELYNSIDINLSGLSGAEGWNLPAFNSTCLGKWSIVLNATSHKDWATEENSIIVNPSSQEEIYDNIFFKKDDNFNQGNFNIFSDEDFYSATEKAISVCKSKNTEGVKLKETFNYSNTINQILKLIKS
jgi:glycosyltransferase involved in cell wall biosynthesis